jgi:hypothetical protein
MSFPSNDLILFEEKAPLLVALFIADILSVAWRGGLSGLGLYPAEAASGSFLYSSLFLQKTAEKSRVVKLKQPRRFFQCLTKTTYM